jgi:hypothetical protein
VQWELKKRRSRRSRKAATAAEAATTAKGSDRRPRQKTDEAVILLFLDIILMFLLISVFRLVFEEIRVGKFYQLASNLISLPLIFSYELSMKN